MEEEMNQESVEEEIATPEHLEDDSTQEIENETQNDQVDHEAQRKQEEQERNWRALRQREKEKELALQKKDEELAMMKELLASFTKGNTQPKEEEQEVYDANEYATFGGIEKVSKKTVQPLEKKISELEAKLQKQDQQKQIDRFKSQYPDFDDVVNVETLELLEQKEPELASSILELKDPFKIGLQSYKYIKALGLAGDVPNARRIKEVEKKLEKNSKAVQSPQAYDKRPMAKAFKTTAADQKRLYEEMMHYASQANGL